MTVSDYDDVEVFDWLTLFGKLSYPGSFLKSNYFLIFQQELLDVSDTENRSINQPLALTSILSVFHERNIFCGDSTFPISQIHYFSSFFHWSLRQLVNFDDGSWASWKHETFDFCVIWKFKFNYLLTLSIITWHSDMIGGKYSSSSNCCSVFLNNGYEWVNWNL